MYGIHRKSGQLYAGRCNLEIVTPISKEDHASLETLYRDYDLRLKSLKNFYKGATIHVFGSGPSLKDVALKLDWSGHITIGVNGVPKVIPYLKYWLMVDDFLYRHDGVSDWICEWFNKNTMIETFVRRGVFKQELLDEKVLPIYLFDGSPMGPGSSINNLFFGRSSTVAAADLARHMGAVKIVLWGCDYNDRSHVYNDTSDGQWPLNQVENEYRKLFNCCREAGVELVNANPRSALSCIPKIDPLNFNPVLINMSEVNKIIEDRDEQATDRLIMYDFEAEECLVFGEVISFNDLKKDKDRKFLMTNVKRMVELYLKE